MQDCAKPTLPGTRLTCLSEHFLHNEKNNFNQNRQTTIILKSTERRDTEERERRGDVKQTGRRVERTGAICPPSDILEDN